MTDVLDMNVHSSDHLTLEDMLNADQGRILDNIKAHLLQQKLHEDQECSCAVWESLLSYTNYQDIS